MMDLHGYTTNSPVLASYRTHLLRILAYLLSATAYSYPHLALTRNRSVPTNVPKIISTLNIAASIPGAQD
ncbi:hypothetical protein BDP27DRAFT_1076079 [Rhodocollybia butyracea]|uniref:Uncharacterized protein n=1 Tax=Rhodocollybia butyracea TaxID=206335 RepID=A0A9P5U3J5_9AGAR|nr:hypothetical protein BDP27DRAFT_1076079 [Rhodocollybia butyracea]